MGSGSRPARALRLAVALAVPFAAAAPGSEWVWAVTPRAESRQTSLDVTIDDQILLPGKTEFEDLVEDRTTLGQGRVEGRRGRGGFFVEGSRVDLEFSEPRLFVLPIPDRVVAVGRLEQTLLALGGLYNAKGTGRGLTLRLGARLVDLVELAYVAVSDPGSLGLVAPTRYEFSSTLWDGLVGFRYTSPAAGRWFFEGEGDASTGDTDLTWKAQAGLGWRFGRNETHALTLAYRILELQIEHTMAVVRIDGLGAHFDRVRVESSIRQSGPLAGVTFGF